MNENSFLSSASEGTIVIATEQFSGKGQTGKYWESEAGKNLTFSILLKPHFLPIEKQFLLNEIISLAVVEFIQTQIPTNYDVKIKWPNDIYVKNKKIAGLLIENIIADSKIGNAIVGIGININQEVFVSDAPNPISLLNITDKTFNLESCLHEVIKCIINYYQMLEDSHFDEINKLYLKSLYRLEEFHNYTLFGKLQQAKIIGITNIGKLVLEIPSGKLIECGMQEVRFE